MKRKYIWYRRHKIVYEMSIQWERIGKTLYKKRKIEFDGVYPLFRNKGQAKKKQKEKDKEEISRPIEVTRILGEKVGYP